VQLTPNVPSWQLHTSKAHARAKPTFQRHTSFHIQMVTDISDKRRFKDKLKHVIAEAEVAQAQAIRDEQTQDVRSLATDLLMSGFPGAFCGVIQC
jgi:hypothetical protein